MLTWRSVFATLYRFFYLSAKIVFHRKLVFMFAGIVVYYGILYAFSVFRPNEGFSVQQALHLLVEAPGTVLAIYLTMDLVAGERDRDTLEILFSTSTSHYMTWGVRIGCVFLLLFATIMAMSCASYFLFAEFPFVWGGANAFFPAFFIGCLTFLFSTSCKSSNASAMLALGVLVGVLLSANLLHGTPYFLFLNPMTPPLGVDEDIWFEKALYNRAVVLSVGIMFVYLSFKKMEHREHLL